MFHFRLYPSLGSLLQLQRHLPCRCLDDMAPPPPSSAAREEELCTRDKELACGRWTWRGEGVLRGGLDRQRTRVEATKWRGRSGEVLRGCWSDSFLVFYSLLMENQIKELLELLI
jgi:hypothetical protein